MIGQFAIEIDDPQTLAAMESSVLWKTSGKGQEDLGVHFFQRYEPPFDRTQLKQPHRFSTVTPPGPLSYDGRTIQIQWLVRIRLIFSDGKQMTEDLPFRLGQVRAPRNDT